MKTKKILLITAFLGGSLALTSTARADYAFSINYGYPDTRHGHYVRSQSRDHHRSRHTPWLFGRPYRSSTSIVYVNTRPATVVVPQAPVATGEKLGIADIIALSKAGVGDAAIIDKINRTGSVFDLSVEEVEAMLREGVSATVVNYMLDTNRR
ncbi:MAG: hypothetical protein ACM3L6_06665 [Deltaproteobacteria bacterium]